MKNDIKVYEEKKNYKAYIITLILLVLAGILLFIFKYTPAFSPKDSQLVENVVESKKYDFRDKYIAEEISKEQLKAFEKKVMGKEVLETEKNLLKNGYVNYTNKVNLNTPLKKDLYLIKRVKYDIKTVKSYSPSTKINYEDELLEGYTILNEDGILEVFEKDERNEFSVIATLKDIKEAYSMSVRDLYISIARVIAITNDDKVFVIQIRTNKEDKKEIEFIRNYGKNKYKSIELYVGGIFVNDNILFVGTDDDGNKFDVINNKKISDEEITNENGYDKNKRVYYKNGKIINRNVKYAIINPLIDNEMYSFIKYYAAGDYLYNYKGEKVSNSKIKGIYVKEWGKSISEFVVLFEDNSIKVSIGNIDI